MKYRRWGVCFTLFFAFVFAGIINDSSYVSAKETIYEYDDSGRVTKVVYEDGSYTEYVYDANGNLLKTIYVEASDVPSEEQSTTEQQNDSEENENNGANNISDSGTGNPENGDEHANGGNIGTNVAGTTGNIENTEKEDITGIDTEKIDTDDAYGDESGVLESGDENVSDSVGEVSDGAQSDEGTISTKKGISKILKIGIITLSIIIGIVLIGIVLWMLIYKRRKR